MNNEFYIEDNILKSYKGKCGSSGRGIIYILFDSRMSMRMFGFQRSINYVK